MAVLRVQAQVDSTADKLPEDAEGEPETEELALVVRLRIGERNRGLGLSYTAISDEGRSARQSTHHPEESRTKSAQRGAEKHKPLRAETVVRVQARGVGYKTRRN